MMTLARLWLFLLTCLSFVISLPAFAQIAALRLETVAGQPGQPGWDDGTGAQAAFSSPASLAVLPDGSVVVADAVNHVIRRVSPAGAVTTFAGVAGQPGFADGSTSTARFRFPNGVAADAQGTIYVADTENCAIRRIGVDGQVSTIGGTPERCVPRDGDAADAWFAHPTGIAADLDGTLYVADRSAHLIRRIRNGSVVTLAGTGLEAGSQDGRRFDARFAFPFSLAIAANGDLFVADSGNAIIRRVTPEGEVTTFCGTADKTGWIDGFCEESRFHTPSGLAFDASGNLFVSDTGNHVIRRITPLGEVTTVAGTGGVMGFRDGSGSSAALNHPYGIVFGAGQTLWLTDLANHVIRRGTAEEVTVRTRPVRR